MIWGAARVCRSGGCSWPGQTGSRSGPRRKATKFMQNGKNGAVNFGVEVWPGLHPAFDKSGREGGMIVA